MNDLEKTLVRDLLRLLLFLATVTPYCLAIYGVGLILENLGYGNAHSPHLILTVLLFFVWDWGHKKLEKRLFGNNQRV